MSTAELTSMVIANITRGQTKVTVELNAFEQKNHRSETRSKRNDKLLCEYSAVVQYLCKAGAKHRCTVYIHTNGAKDTTAPSRSLITAARNGPSTSPWRLAVLGYKTHLASREIYPEYTENGVRCDGRFRPKFEKVKIDTQTPKRLRFYAGKGLGDGRAGYQSNSVDGPTHLCLARWSGT